MSDPGRLPSFRVPARAALAAVLLLACVLRAPAGHSTWEDRTDLIYGSAHTLDQGEFEVGVFAPLQYGVSDRIQVALHPVLLLVLAPHLSLRWRLGGTGRLTFALNPEVSFSFLDRVDGEGRRVTGDGGCTEPCGFPGTVQVTGTASWEVVQGVMLSAGLGPAADFLDVTKEREMLELHASLLWLLDPRNLLMVHGNTYAHPGASGSPPSRSTLQLMYARAFGDLHVGAGFVLGDISIVIHEPTVSSGAGGAAREVKEGDIRSWPIYPMADLWLRL